MKKLLVLAAVFILAAVLAAGVPSDLEALRKKAERTVSISQAGDLAGSDAIIGNLRFIPAGTFVQGSPDTEPCRYSENQFTHTLTLNLAVMETEVTRQMWADLLAVQPTLPADPTETNFGSGMTNPVQNNDWYEAVLFANLLSLQNGLTQCYFTDAGFTTPITSLNYQTDTVYCRWNATGYRLPSEGEWEYFCRAGTTGPFSASEPDYGSGSCSTCTPSPALTALDFIAWWCGNSSNTTYPVGQKAANPWNLKDTHGNVWEWCWDGYDTYPTGSVTDYRVASASMGRIFRGGGWDYEALYARSANRRGHVPSHRYRSLGFRLVRTLSMNGDIDGDGQVNSADLLLLARYLADKLSGEPFNLSAGDLNHDGQLNALDLVLLMQALT